MLCIRYQVIKTWRRQYRDCYALAFDWPRTNLGSDWLALTRTKLSRGEFLNIFLTSVRIILMFIMKVICSFTRRDLLSRQFAKP